MNQLNEIRHKVGLSKPEFLRLLGAKEGRKHLLLNAGQENVDPLFLKRAEAILAQYREFMRWLGGYCDAYEHTGINELTMPELQDLTGLREAHIVTLRNAGDLKTVRRGIEYLYTIDGLREAMQVNGIALDQGRRRGPLGTAFLRWLAKAETQARLGEPVARAG